MQFQKKRETNPEQLERETEFQGVNRSDLHDKVKTDIRPSRGDRILDAFIIGILVIIAVACFYPLFLVLICSCSDPQYIGYEESIYCSGQNDFPPFARQGE